MSAARTRKTPFAWRQLLHYANGRPTAATWRQFLLRRSITQPVPDDVTLGLSFAELEPVLAEFRSLLDRLLSFRTVRQAEASDVMLLINQRAQGQFRGWIWLKGTGKLFPRVEPKDRTVEQTLYAQLALALTVEPFTAFKRCKQCGRFFYEPRRQRARLCSAACRRADAKTRALQYRETHQEDYRNYQRKLMAKRREDGKA
jgi:hypothetical protein